MSTTGCYEQEGNKQIPCCFYQNYSDFCGKRNTVILFQIKTTHTAVKTTHIGIGLSSTWHGTSDGRVRGDNGELDVIFIIKIKQWTLALALLQKKLFCKTTSSYQWQVHSMFRRYSGSIGSGCSCKAALENYVLKSNEGYSMTIVPLVAYLETRHFCQFSGGGDLFYCLNNNCTTIICAPDKVELSYH